MAIEGVDYAGSRPSPAGLFAAGKRFVVRYGGPGGDWKHLTATEARALIGAGLSLVANAEGTASGMLGGWSAGADWAAKADQHFRALGMPAGRPIYLSVDFDVTSGQWPTCAQALRGAASVVGAGRVGVYGSYDVMQWAKRDGVARWYWQTYAWSSGRWAAHNHLEQYRNGVSVAGGTVDLCRALTADYGQWGTEEDDMDAEQDLRLRRVEGHAAAISNRLLTIMSMLPAAKYRVPGEDVDRNEANKLGALLSTLAGKDMTDEAAIAAAVLAALSPQTIAAAIVAALPANLAGEVADELAARLQS